MAQNASRKISARLHHLPVSTLLLPHKLAANRQPARNQQLLHVRREALYRGGSETARRI